MILIVVLLIILFISYLISFLVKPLVAFFYGDKIREKLSSLRKKDSYYREQYKESRKYIDSLDKGFLKSVSEAFHGSNCTEEDYVTEKKKEEERSIEKSYNSELSVYSFGVSLVCILGLIGFGAVFKDDLPEQTKPKNPISEKKAYFKKQCEGLDLKTIEADFKKLSALQEEADMLKKRAKILYKNGLILHSQYQQAKDNRSAIGIKFNMHYFCIQAREDYRRSIATAITESSQETIENNASPTKTNEPLINISSPVKQYTDSEIKEVCQHCITYYNCEINKYQKTLHRGKYINDAFSCTSNVALRKSYEECVKWQSFLLDKFINEKKEKAFYEADYTVFPDYFEKCTEKQKASCITSYCRSNHPSGVYEIPTFRCELKDHIGIMKFHKAAYCGKLRNRFFSLKTHK